MKNKDWWKFWKVGSTPLKPHGYAEISIKGHKGISEPVFTIVKSFGEKGRWKVKPDFDVLKDNMLRTAPSFTVCDTKTCESYKLYCGNYLYCVFNCDFLFFPCQVYTHHLPSWMTEQEKEYVCKAVEQISQKVKERFLRVEDRRKKSSDKQALVNKIKERSRLQKLYCGE